jgi:hypothetical protein
MISSRHRRVFRAPKILARLVVSGIRGCDFGRLRQIRGQLKEFRDAPDHLRSSRVEAGTRPERLVARLEEIGVPLRKTAVDVADFLKWREGHPILVSTYRDHGEVAVEKVLEHYLTMTYLPILAGDRVIDVAAASSPFVGVLTDELRTQAYRLDLSYKPGIHGDQIGGNAGSMPVADGFADVLTLHCAFECFQDPSDVMSIREAARVLRKGGRLGIVPLYLDETYFVKIGPRADKRKIRVEDEARLIWRDDGHDSEPFSRHYSPDSLKQRILDNMGNLECEIVYFTNLEELRNEFPGQRIYCDFLLRAVK